MHHAAAMAVCRCAAIVTLMMQICAAVSFSRSRVESVCPALGSNCQPRLQLAGLRAIFWRCRSSAKLSGARQCHSLTHVRLILQRLQANFDISPSRHINWAECAYALHLHAARITPVRRPHLLCTVLSAALRDDARSTCTSWAPAFAFCCVAWPLILACCFRFRCVSLSRT